MLPFLTKYGIYIFLVIIVMLAPIASPKFLNLQNITNILGQSAALGMVGIGQTFVILSGGGGLDLSVASIMSTVAVIVSVHTSGSNELLFTGVLVCLIFGLTVGLINGLLITKRKVSPVMCTLGMMMILQGLRFVYTGGAPAGDFPSFLRYLGTANFGPIPVSFISLCVMTVVAAIVLKRTRFGRQLYVTGGNRETAELSGYNTDRIIITAYMISGLSAAIAGLYLGGWLGILDNWVGKGYEIDSIAVVVMGGTSFAGGRGGVFGTIGGVLILAVLYNLILLIGLPVDVQYAIKGAVIILAASFYVHRKQR